MPGNCDSLTCSREDGAITVGSHFGSRRTALQRDWLPSGIGRSALTCEDACAGTGCEGPSAALAMQEVKDHLQDRNMPLSCGNVELRGFESLTSCMPYRPRPSLSVGWHRLASRLAAAIVARRGLTSPGSCRRWLPTWLPANSLAPLMFEARIATPGANARRPGERADQRRRMTASAPRTAFPSSDGVRSDVNRGALLPGGRRLLASGCRVPKFGLFL